ncbi:MAG: FtsX-like permease family protein [Solirubrobacteraceae bacterium]|nr:FtsX-like permease family protein [Solirubrobacteraceae bacterium]
MNRFAFRGMLERKARTAFTLFAVVLGVALIAGTFVLTDSISRSFDRLVATSGENIDVHLTAPGARGGFSSKLEYFPESVAARIDRVDGVRAVAGSIGGLPVTVVDDRGRRIGPSTGAPTLAFSAAPPQFDLFDHTGEVPSRPGEIALSAQTARDAGLRLGDRVRVQGIGPVRPFRLVGFVTFGGASSLGGAIFVMVTLDDAEALSGHPGQVTEMNVQADAGVTPPELKTRVQTAVGAAATVRTGEEDRAQQSKDLSQILTYLTLGLLVFGLVALLVGSFVIFNTFSITVAQRTREFGMLRTIGASRRQVLWSVVLEAFAIGLVGSVLGLAAGVGLAPLLSALLSSVGLDLPDSGTVIAARTVVVAVGLGTIVTVLSSLSPAVRAMRVPPIEAMREGTVSASRKQRRVARWAQATFAGLGLALMVAGLFAGSGVSTSLALLGAVVVLIGVGMLSPVLVGPLAAAIGRPMAMTGGVAAEIARGNAVRSPGRTAGTASSLMVGVALVAFVAIFVNGFKASFSGAFDRAVSADFVVFDPTGLTPEGVAEAAAELPSVAVATNFRTVEGQLADGRAVSVNGLDPGLAGRVMRIDWAEGGPETLQSLQPADALVERDWAKAHRVTIGSALRLESPQGRGAQVTVRGLYLDHGQIFGDVILPDRTVRDVFDVQTVTAAFVVAAPGASQRVVRSELAGMLAREFPTLEPQTRREFIDGQVGAVDQILYVFYVLLALSVVIALFGIVNTLALSVYERTRELGLLRAVGASRRQVRRIVRGEAIITSVMGATIGVAVGVLFGVLVSRPLASEGFVIAIPWSTLVVLLLLSVVAGFVAAVAPARRAARIDVLSAVTRG